MQKVKSTFIRRGFSQSRVLHVPCTSVHVKVFPSTDVEVDRACVASLPAGQNANYIIGLVALDADSAVIKVSFRFLVTLPDGTNL